MTDPGATMQPLHSDMKADEFSRGWFCQELEIVGKDDSVSLPFPHVLIDLLSLDTYVGCGSQ